MPNYWNPTNPMYPVTYPMSSYPTYPMQQSYAQPTIAATWVEGEMEARGKSMPQGVNQYFMFDANQQKIYLKSLNQMGMPNPMQTLSFTIDPQQNLPAGQSGAMSGTNQDMSNYVTKQDLEQLRNEIRQMGQSGSINGNSGNSGGGQSYANNQNGGNSNGNRGGNR